MNRLIYITQDIPGCGSKGNEGEDALVRNILDQVLLLSTVDKDKPIHVLIESNGGCVKTALSIYDILKMSEAPIYTYALSEVSSAGVLIYLAGSKRFAFKHSQFMTHPSTMSLHSTDKDFDQIADTLKEQNKRTKMIYKGRLRLSEKKYNKLHTSTNYLWPDEAKKYKIVTEIIEKFPEDLLFGSLDFTLEVGGEC